jgi:hypothetical protein
LAGNNSCERFCSTDDSCDDDVDEDDVDEDEDEENEEDEDEDEDDEDEDEDDEDVDGAEIPERFHITTLTARGRISTLETFTKNHPFSL